MKKIVWLLAFILLGNLENLSPVLDILKYDFHILDHSPR